MAARHRAQSRLGSWLPWGPVALGVAILSGYLIYAMLPFAASSPLIIADAGRATDRAPATTSAPTAVPTSADPAHRGPAARRPAPVQHSPAAPEPTPSPTAEAELPALVAEYRLVDTGRRSFTAELVITNPADQPQDWRVRLVYPDRVGRLTSHSVDSGAPPAASREGADRFFTGAEALAPGDQVVLRVSFERGGRNLSPQTCTVNGEGCLIS